jgi:hypothetical protein
MGKVSHRPACLPPSLASSHLSILASFHSVILWGFLLFSQGRRKKALCRFFHSKIEILKLLALKKLEENRNV